MTLVCDEQGVNSETHSDSAHAANKWRNAHDADVDEGRKRVIGLMAAILASLHMRTADDLFGGPQASPRTDKLISASIQSAEKIMAKIDEQFSAGGQ